MKVISTLKVNCKDCHRCVRSCPVKAIAIEKGQARLIGEKCVLCGKCVVECPQHAKQVASQVSLVQQAIANGKMVVMSIAPSFVAAFPDYTPEQLVAVIHALGFQKVEETVIGASVVSETYGRLFSTADKPVISACCPVVVDLVQKFYPQLVENIANVVSPMVAHGMMIKQKYGLDSFVVFAGPCIAKMAEQQAYSAAVDAVITFEQLRSWLKEASDVDKSEAFSSEAAESIRYYPIAGGILKSFIEHDYTNTDVLSIDGIEKCMEVFDGLIKGEISPRFIEAMACSGGCIAGPAIGNSLCVPAKRTKVIEFARRASAKPRDNLWIDLNFNRDFLPSPFTNPLPTEEQIKEIMRLTGKLSPKDEKNCAACGYNSCRENAIAVFQGLTEIDTCVPYMRSKAESFANIIVANSLNAIIVVNEQMVIQEFNPAAEVMFNRQKEINKGISLTELMDCSDIVTAVQTGTKITGKRIEFPLYGLIAEEMIIPVRQHGLVIIIIMDVTAHEKRARELERMKLETVEKATEIINKQMHVAQEIAGLLGETTAETKSALLELIWLLKEKGEN